MARMNFGQGMDVRQLNLSTVASLVHRHKVVARSAITRESGLSRSSIATLIADLESVGVIQQTAPTSTVGIGRPSPDVSPTDRFLAVAVNPDVNGVRIALVSMGGDIVEQVARSTSMAPTPSEAARLTADGIRELAAARPRSRLLSICAAIPGRVSKDGKVVAFAPHLRWRDVPFSRLLTEATGLEAEVAFDARVGMLAESLWGIARDETDVVYLYGGPGGIGASAMVDGRILSGASGAAARLGHLLVAADGPPCVCGNVGCLTTLVSRHQIASAFDLEGGSLDELRQAVLSEQSPRLCSFVDRQAGLFASALRTVTHVYDPRRIILGGFFEILLAARESQLKAALADDNLRAIRNPPELVTPGLGADQLLVGAGHVVFQPLLADPLGYLRARAS